LQHFLAFWLKFIVEMYVVPEISGQAASAMQAHSFADGHIESPQRLKSALEAISKISKILKNSTGDSVSLQFLPDRSICDDEILLGHTKEMLDAFRGMETGKLNLWHFPASAVVDRLASSTLAARFAAGSVLQLIDSLKANPYVLLFQRLIRIKTSHSSFLQTIASGYCVSQTAWTSLHKIAVERKRNVQ
jgi:acetoin utilization deacetylase AcuC-like enzyme